MTIFYITGLSTFQKKSLKIPKGICISKKNRKHNGQKKKYKWTNNDVQNIHRKLKISEAVNIRTENTMAKRQIDKMTNNDL